MKYLAAGIQTGDKVKKALVGGTMAATPISCVAGYYTLEEIERTNACERAGRMGDLLVKGLKELIKKYNLPFVAFNQGSICHLETVGTMHFSINWKKPGQFLVSSKKHLYARRKWSIWGQPIWQKDWLPWLEAGSIQVLPMMKI